MPLSWIKMWLEGLDDPKLTRLSLAERGAWWGLLKLAGKCEAGGKIVAGGLGLDIDEIADALHIKSSEDKGALESMLTKLEKLGSLKWNQGALTVVHFEERQSIPPSARPEAVAERVRSFRERQKRSQLSPQQVRDANRLGKIAIAYRKKQKELGRDLTTEERLEVEAEVDKELRAKGKEGTL